MTYHDSVTKLIKLHNSLSIEELDETYPEFSSSKSTICYVFEKKTETCEKDGTEKSYERTTRDDKTNNVSTKVEQLINSWPNYLRHQQHVDNIYAVLSKVKDQYTDRFLGEHSVEN